MIDVKILRKAKPGTATASSGASSGTPYQDSARLARLEDLMAGFSVEFAHLLRYIHPVGTTADGTRTPLGWDAAPDTVTAIEVTRGLYSTDFLSARGASDASGSGTGVSYDRLDAWADYASAKSGWVLSAALGHDLHTRLTDIESKYLTRTDAASVYLTKTDAASSYLTKTDASSTYLTKTAASASYQPKGSYLTAHQSIRTLTIQKNGTDAGTYDPTAATATTINIPDVASATALSTHTADTTLHITAAERTLWNQTADTLPDKLNVTGSNGTHAGVSELIQKLGEATSAVTDATYLVTSNASPSATNNLFYRRKASLLWDYIRGKSDARYLGISANAASATKLQTSRKLWGQDFDGTKDVSGQLSDVTNIWMAGNLFLHKGDPAKGFYLQADDNGDFGLHTHENFGWKKEVLRILHANGYIGINTQAPEHLVDVNGTARVRGAITTPRLYITGTASSNAYISADSSKNIYINVGGVTPLVLNGADADNPFVAPATSMHNKVDLGTSTRIWRRLYVSEIRIGDCTITYDGDGLRLSTGVYSDGYVSSRGQNPAGGSSGGSLFGLYSDFTKTPSASDALSAVLGKWLYDNKLSKSDAEATYLTQVAAAGAYQPKGDYLTAHQALDYINDKYVTRDTEQSITAIKTFSARPAFDDGIIMGKDRMMTLQASTATQYGKLSNSYIHTGTDGATSTDANLRFGSWYGVGWYPSVANQTVPQGENAMWLNVRVGDLTVRGKYIVHNGAANKFLMQDGSTQTLYKAENVTTATSDDGTITPKAMNDWTSKTFLKLSGGTMANTNVVVNLNADLLNGLHASEFARGGVASYAAPTETAGRWIRIAEFDTYVSYATIDICNNYTNNPTRGIKLIFHNAFFNEPSNMKLTSIGCSAMINKARIVYPDANNKRKYYLEVYYVAEKANTLHLRMSNSLHGSLLQAYTSGEIPANYLVKEFALANGIATETLTTTGTITTGGTITSGGAVLPATTHAQNLGSTAKVWERAYIRYIDTDTGYDLRLCAAGKERLHVNASNGHVGVHVTSPEYPLDIQGNTRVSGDINIFTYTDSAGKVNGGRIYLTDYSAANTGSKGIYLQASTAGHLYAGAHTNGSSDGVRLDMDWDGNLGVGGWSDSAFRLTVNGGSIIKGALWLNDGSSNAVLTKTSSGLHLNVGFYSDSFITSRENSTTSDIRFKTDLRPIPLSIEAIAEAPAVNFRWKDTGRSGFGSTAQYWERAIPEAVREVDGIKRLDSGNTALVAAIVTGREVIALRAEVKSLKEKVKRLESSINS
ncbi:MAG: tail fiber domain-containing protein [Bacteroides sp.]|nr:tail fiber domain-containing protein [Bacteroides sp.]